MSTSREMSLLAKRFDTALNNMPHGLCMFNSDRRIVVSNQKLNQLLGLPGDLELKGVSLRELADNAVTAGLICASNARSMVDGLDVRLAGDDDSAFVVDMNHGRTLEFTTQPMENGGMVAVVEDVTERRAVEAKINQLARFDPLTGLPNRNVLRERMERALGAWRPDNMCAIHFVDLDQFKQVNDTLGHTRGDMLLQAVAERLRSPCARPTSFAASAATSSSSCRRRSPRLIRAKRGGFDPGSGRRHLRSRRPQGRRNRQHRHRSRHPSHRPGSAPA